MKVSLRSGDGRRNIFVFIFLFIYFCTCSKTVEIYIQGGDQLNVDRQLYKEEKQVQFPHEDLSFFFFLFS